jgi:PBSX family phage portal protein
MSVSIKKKDPTPAGTKQLPEYTLTGIASKPSPLSTQVVSNTFESEDEFKALYGSATTTVQVLEPPYNLKTLDRLSQENNALSPCIEAMVTNIDGTGFDFVKDTWGAQEAEKPESDPKMAQLWDFFKQPWPGESYLSQRKKVRRDIERLGNGYLEILTNLAGQIMFTRHMDAKLMRLLKLDDAVAKKITLKRGGQEMEVTVNVRERRFAQSINGKNVIYFKEFGCVRDLDKYTGEWAKPGEALAVDRRATAVLHFKCLPDAHTPYGVPRWVSQLPSVLGSRKAEEYNLDYFDNGGVPPVMILIQGGVLGSETRKRLENAASGKATTKNRVTVVEMEPTGGSLESTSASKVTVERFGSEKQNDSMFEKYDERCEIRVRRSFRLPPIFTGNASDYSFATAFASYTVAEAQVFRLEREDHDEVISTKLLPALGYDGYLMKSKPLNIEDATIKLQAIEVGVAANALEPVSVVNALNGIAGTNLKHGTTQPIPTLTGTTAPGGSTGSTGGKGKATNSPPGKEKVAQPVKATPARSPAVRKSADEMADMAARLIGSIKANRFDVMSEVLGEVANLDAEGIEDFQMEVQDLSLSAMDEAA